MFKNITLEMSLKPFKQTDDGYIRNICAQIFSQWRPLLKNRESISVMLWTSDGSEILDYAGRLDAEFEWGRFWGTANKPFLAEGEPLETSLHNRTHSYLQNAPKMTYAILKKIVATLKDEGKKAFPDAIIRIGETFDIGPEFTKSDFKYKYHNEICSGTVLDGEFGFIDATALLNADTREYAAYPHGIPQDTPFGTFLGKQSEIFLADMEFDYLWLSNGLGFSANPWDKTGKIFDGEKYYPEKLKETKRNVFKFWKLFREECKFPLETRGTNNSVGIDYASDGVPLYDIYNSDLDITAPPNSPWAALNDNYGLEVMGHMTRICELPNEKFPFRYYVHDPWWLNSPWYDRYDGSPCDIYLPMAITRIDADGKVEAANTLNILAIDNSHGDMPDNCVNEPLPHLLRAEKNAADSPAPLVWVYPLREYTSSDDASLLREMNLGDNYICDAINDGLPLCSVVSTDNFLKHSETLYKESVLISPVPVNTAVLDRFTALGEQGINVIMYGTIEKLNTIKDFRWLTKIDIEKSPSAIRKALSPLGYEIEFSKKEEAVKPPTMAISRRDNALLFSVYNSNTTTDAKFRFPLGAPILIGCEAEMTDGKSSYRFSRGEQRECRVYAEQESGFIACREAPPVNARYRRAIRVNGLKDATVRLFPEKGCECAVSTADNNLTPKYDSRFRLVHDENGTYLLGEHVNGRIHFLIGHKNTL